LTPPLLVWVIQQKKKCISKHITLQPLDARV
jgi:hypothetical protein